MLRETLYMLFVQGCRAVPEEEASQEPGGIASWEEKGYMGEISAGLCSLCHHHEAGGMPSCVSGVSLCPPSEIS